MHAAVYVGAIHFVKLANRLDHRVGLLRVAALSRLHQRLAVYGLLENREILPIRSHVEAKPAIS